MVWGRQWGRGFVKLSPFRVVCVGRVGERGKPRHLSPRGKDCLARRGMWGPEHLTRAVCEFRNFTRAPRCEAQEDLEESPASPSFQKKNMTEAEVRRMSQRLESKVQPLMIHHRLIS